MLPTVGSNVVHHQQHSDAAENETHCGAGHDGLSPGSGLDCNSILVFLRIQEDASDDVQAGNERTHEFSDSVSEHREKN